MLIAMKNLKQFILWMFLLCVGVAYSQKISGLITNEANQPLEAVYIYNLNSKDHAHSLENGAFFLNNAKIGDSLKIGLLGYEVKTVVLDKNSFGTKLQIMLQEKSFVLNEMVITEQIDALNTISKMDINLNPVNSSQEILRKVPGLIIGQHAGGGKAEQLFLRGFDIDHGTDISLSVDGMPVNMVSHAHGQGYGDLHFLIPETINKIDFGKGPYYAKEGDFNTAAYVGFSTKDYLKESSVSLSLGQFNSLRTLGMFNLLEDLKDQNAYIAVEYLEGDGPFQSPQNFNRLNVFSKYVMLTPKNDKLALSVSHFASRWDASGQIPQREVNNGNITRFGAIDDTEGGNTSRTNLNLNYYKNINEKTTLTSSMFYTNYNFELYSNFTFFLEDPTNGDQIRQKENRSLFGTNTMLEFNSYFGKVPLNIKSGLGLRYDKTIDTELSKTLNRTTTLQTLKLGDIDQTNMNGFVNTEFEFDKLKINLGLRLDYFKFLYNDKLQTAYTLQSETKTILSPKLNFLYNAKTNLQLYLKSGIGFHSNDTRVVVSNYGMDILPKAYGLDIGNVWKPTSKLFINFALWYLFLEQEFVYVGDAGIVEPSGKTERYGLDLGFRHQLNDWLFLDTEMTLTKARSIDEPKSENRIPLAPDFTMAGGISFNKVLGFSGGLRYRYLDDRPANEDNSIVAEGYFVTDFNLNYSFKNITLGFIIENIFDTQWNETQFATESKLQNEMQSTEEIHFTPGTPFFLRANLIYNF